MKRPGDDGYDFPCGDSHSRIDYAYEVTGKSKLVLPGFRNNNSGELYRVTTKGVAAFREELIEQVRICNIFLRNANKKTQTKGT